MSPGSSTKNIEMNQINIEMSEGDRIEETTKSNQEEDYMQRTTFDHINHDKVVPITKKKGSKINKQ